MGASVVALVCDPGGGRGAGIGITANGKRAPVDARLGIAQMLAGQPFADGARIEFALGAGSPQTVAALRAMGDGRPADVVIAPFDPPASRYDVEIDGRVARVTTDTGREREIQIGKPAPQVEVKDGSPEEIIRSFVALTSHGDAGLRPACELLAEDTRDAYESGEFGCEGILGLVMTYDEYGEYPEPGRTELGEVSLPEGSDPTIAVAELTHHYRPDKPGQPRVKRVEALVPVSEEDGHWRILVPNWLSPIRALKDDTTPTDADIRRELAEVGD